MRQPIFVKTEPDLWQWGEWFIACAHDQFWLLTSASREFGPFRCFEEVLTLAGQLA